ncbi:AAA domain-containing protein [Anaerospora sp.]|uniref:AAA domain-containing protein n=1 Tax=Anaerospora sp. TaxID=1960278 RepID=UPI0028988BAE|nr:AAA domain-containing protein [Anaerospora sp.]
MDYKTLQYWHKLEHFYPYILNDQDSPFIKTHSINCKSQFPDLETPTIPASKKLRRYAIYLGIFRMDSALCALEKGMKTPMKFRDSGDDESCFCMFNLSPIGVFDSESFRISSFPWAIHRVKDGGIVIDQWDKDFKAFELKLFQYLNDNKEPYTYDFLEATRNYFASQINWDIAFSDCWLRIDMVLEDADKIKVTEMPLPSGNLEDNTNDDLLEETNAKNEAIDELVKQNDLLNSFYIRDLERIIESLQEDCTDYGQAFAQYMSQQSGQRVNVESDIKAQLELMSPTHLPFGRWPSNYGMRFMQQIAVNAFMCKDTKYQQDFFSVNGPPGTGKTTLLKDIIAAIIVERAIEMARLDMPDSAFNQEVLCSISYKNFSNEIRDIAPAIKGHGILVTSNNNSAVENITNELPSISEMPEKYQSSDYHYFSEVSDMIFGDGTTWALNAASLGNKRKRTTFIDKFWPIAKEEEKDLKYDFNKELREKVKRISPEEWNKAKQSFNHTLKQIKSEYARIQTIYNQTCLLLESNTNLSALIDSLQILESQIQKTEEQLVTCQNDILGYTQRKELLLLQKLDLSSIDRLLWLKKMIWPKHKLVQKYTEIVNALEQNSIDLVNMRDKLDSIQKQIKALSHQKKSIEKERNAVCEKIAHLEAGLEAFRAEMEAPYRIDQYFIKQPTDISKSSPWGYSALNILREQLFLEALQLHKAFVCNSKNLRSNLDAFGKMMRGQIPKRQLPIVAPVLLQSLFLIVPVISTTFASVSSFLKDIPKNEIAYLFIDEAGQAMPQSAVGAIWRSKKVIAVGDPLQIEPVVTLHDNVIQVLADYYYQSQLIKDKNTSVQTLADLINIIGGYRTLEKENDLWIGAPLVVHNRCQQQVFHISNKIAYDNKMVYATKDHQNAVCRWIHVSGTSQNGHFVPNQAEAITEIVLDSFKTLGQTENGDLKIPSLFLITPFRSVRAGLINHFRKVLPDLFIQNKLDIPKKELRKWISTSIGTIHTFQGKQANTVILCLGVGSDGKNMGAVNWASASPNILNVAVTRSKIQLYIVGDKTLWQDKPHFDKAYTFCDKPQC